MDIQLLIDRLEIEWNLDQSFLGKLRLGTIDASDFSRPRETL